MREELRGEYEQVPQLSSSRPVDLRREFRIFPEEAGGVRRALLIGINYVGQRGELRGCHNDVRNIERYLTGVLGFEERNITVLMDDGEHEHPSPTRDNIMQAFRHFAGICEEGDAFFCHFSGHGGRLPDNGSDESDGYDETLIPVDFQQAGQIRDDAVLRTLILPMAAGAHVFCLIDSCHSGTVLDLPYVFRADDPKFEICASPRGEIEAAQKRMFAREQHGYDFSKLRRDDERRLYSLDDVEAPRDASRARRPARANRFLPIMLPILCLQAVVFTALIYFVRFRNVDTAEELVSEALGLWRPGDDRPPMPSLRTPGPSVAFSSPPSFVPELVSEAIASSPPFASSSSSPTSTLGPSIAFSSPPSFVPELVSEAIASSPPFASSSSSPTSTLGPSVAFLSPISFFPSQSPSKYVFACCSS
mmetsp:Transcript_27346/g.62781  ORF Transcript_27346/g.62781 Transcript_27346/m.62781 type:complete len:420 (-) Transcript_27346:861-2120(-)